MVAKMIRRLPSKLDRMPTSQRYRTVSDAIQGGFIMPDMQSTCGGVSPPSKLPQRMAVSSAVLEMAL